MFLDNFMTFFTFLLISPLLSRSFANAGSSVRIENNGYTNVVVAIAPHISEQEGTELITKIQELFIEASVNLYEATRHRAYFKEVNILVPQGWSNDGNYSESSFENFDDADIRVDDPNPTYGDGPYTLQSLPCGDPGHYIHLTPSYLRNLRGNSTELFGPSGKTLVHEWAHLRYGIFDEFGYPGNEQYPVFYFKDNQMLVPNACANSKLFGTYKTADSGPCDYPNGYPDKNCIFIPNQNKIEANTSIASYHFLPKVSMFCDDSPSHAHDPQAPNKHNALCESRSTWSVISAHSDFTDRNLPNNITDLVPAFKFIQKKRNTFCLSLDASSSMVTANRMILLKEAVTRLIMYDIPLGTEMAITKFGKEGSTLNNMTTIKTDSDREALNAAVQSNLNATEDYTCLVQGLKSCVEILKDYRQTPGGVIIMITDGDDTCNDTQKINWYKEEFLQSQARLISITFGAAALENDLAKLALETGGKAFFVPDSNEDVMGNTFFDIFTQQSTDTDVYIKIYEENFPDVIQQNITGKFFIDSTLGRNVSTTVIFKYETDITDIENILIYGPSTNLSLTDGNKTLSHYIHFQFDSPQAGEFNYILSRKNNSTTSFHVSVTTRSPNKIKPITTRAWVHQIKVMEEEYPRYIIYAEVKQGNNPVINAKVVAKIDGPSGVPVFVDLFDKGNGDPDITRDDGIYSRYFTKFSGIGRYAVQAQITTDGSTAIVDSGFTASSSMPVVNNYMGNLKPKTRAAETFQRLAIANEINLNDTGSVTYPPSRITDLLVVNISTYDNSSKVTLQWTAPGGTLDEGKAHHYELYYSTNWNDLYPVSTINASTFTLDISPSLSGTIEITSVNISGLVIGVTYYLNLVASNDRTFSKHSNIVSAQIIVPVEPEDDDQMIPIIVGIVLGVLFLLFVITSLTLYIRKKHRKNS